MPFCQKCGRGLPLDAEYCSNCGTKAESSEANTQYKTYEEPRQEYTYTQAPPNPPYESYDDGAARRQKTLDNFYLRLKWELKAWSIASKVLIIFGAILMAFTMIFFIAGVAGGSDTVALIPFSMYYGFLASTVLGIGVVNSVMKGKVQKYMEGLYYDCGPAVVRGESIGMIVFNYFFNTIALVFFLINFIQIKMHKEEFEEIRRLQLNARQNSANNNTVYWQ